MARQPPKFTRHVWSQLWRLSKPFFFGKTWRRAWFLLAALLSLSLLVTYVGIKANMANGNFVNALQIRDDKGYSYWLKFYLATFALSVPLAAFYRYCEERLGLSWRDVLARTLMQRYFHNRAYFHLGSSEAIDNPDQRISEDAKNFTITTLSFLLIIMNSVIQIVGYTGVLMAISPRLVAALFGYAFFGTAGAYLIGKRLIGLNYMQYEREANFRYGLVRVRDNAESIAFYRGERRELNDLRARLGAVVGNMMVLIRWNRNLAFFTTGYNSLALILPVLFVAPLYLQGKVGLGEITKATGAFAVVLAAVSMVITQFERLSAFAAGVTRLGDLWDYLDERDAEDDLDQEGENIDICEEERTIVLEDLTVKTPQGQRVLLKDLTFRLPPGGSLLIMGESGSGKSSLLRTIAGLWSCGEGFIGRPPYRNMMFLPQRPYMIPGSLRNLLEYPGAKQKPDDNKLREVLKIVNLRNLAGRVENDFDREADWSNMLSLGEQQRVSFARLLLRKPAIAFLDESTSALDEPNEERAYHYLREHRYTYVSVGHRSTLLQHHDWLMKIGKDATWEIHKISEMEEQLPDAARQAGPGL
ncbi:ABC transporter ATP-binding protein/permease [Luteolibacter ambystomatis]|uniref:ABC transporter ATP-binding protein/permease n=1 Tax=Luteolibacter ambystomatis TaxID=2824561 RepID=A0A975J1Z5_9BACT|nr:ABC transporter ATP-binding protein/permease [Luteolibacter ambystomatis]QUE52521.1 ABC transporter ATP-binding protein/permease [Luteolibacter ambystomatis]